MTATDPQAWRAQGPAIGIHASLESFGELTAISRTGGQGRVFGPAHVPPGLGQEPLVVKLYRRPPPPEAADVLADMVRWERSLSSDQRGWMRYLTAWPVGVVTSGGRAVGIAMRDVSGQFAAPFRMPSGRRENVLLALEHLLGGDSYLQMRGLDIRLDTDTRARVAERISATLAFLHQHAIVVSDIAPSNLLVSFGQGATNVCFIDCDSMVFRGRQALASVETADWNLPAGFAEPPRTRASDAYKLGLVILRLFARSHDARSVAAHLRQVPVELRDLLHRALAADAPNRPAPGEWQRALHGLVVGGELNQRHPGPAIRVAAPGAPASPPVRAAAEHRSAVRPFPWLARSVIALWTVALVIVFVLLFSRLDSGSPSRPAITTFYPQGPGGRVYPSVHSLFGPPANQSP